MGGEAGNKAGMTVNVGAVAPHAAGSGERRSADWEGPTELLGVAKVYFLT